MSEFRFIGDPNAGGHGPELVDLFGHVFCREGWTKVEGEAAARCARHSHLEQRLDDDTSDPAGQPRRRGRPPKVREG